MKFLRINQLAALLSFILPATCLQAGPTPTHPKLLFAVDLIRHGNRAPVHPLTGTGKIDWPASPGGLLPSGMKQQYELGKQQRQFYLKEGLIPSHCYTPKRCLDRIYVRSSNFDRTLMSANSFLFGFFPLGIGPQQNGHHYLPPGYLPVPIHTQPKSEDALLLTTDKPFFQKQVAKRMGRALKNPWLIKHRKLFSRIAGRPIRDRLDFLSFADALVARKFAHLPMPRELTATDIHKILFHFNRLYTLRLADKKLSAIASRHILQTIVDHFIDHQQGKSPVQYLLLSGHDDNLLAVLNTITDIQHQQPALASVLSFEFYQVHKRIRLDIEYNHHLIRQLWLNHPLKRSSVLADLKSS